jgi:hypothetical protein
MRIKARAIRRAGELLKQFDARGKNPAAGLFLKPMLQRKLARSRNQHIGSVLQDDPAAEGYTHIECSCPRCRMIRLRPMDWLPRISMGLTLAQLSERLRCADCGGQLHSVRPWRQADMLGKPQGRRG